MNERQDNCTVRMQEVAKVDDFKYMDFISLPHSPLLCTVKKRVHAGGNGWRRMSGVICDRRVPARVKGKVYKVAVRPAMLYGLETVALTKRQEADMEVAELKMLRFSNVQTISGMSTSKGQHRWDGLEANERQN